MNFSLTEDEQIMVELFIPDLKIVLLSKIDRHPGQILLFVPLHMFFLDI